MLIVQYELLLINNRSIKIFSVVVHAGTSSNCLTKNYQNGQ
nr:MAG TPA: hypothetical protein [Crassvirales sp.]